MNSEERVRNEVGKRWTSFCAYFSQQTSTPLTNVSGNSTSLHRRAKGGNQLNFVHARKDVEDMIRATDVMEKNCGSVVGCATVKGQERSAECSCDAETNQRARRTKNKIKSNRRVF